MFAFKFGQRFIIDADIFTNFINSQSSIIYRGYGIGCASISLTGAVSFTPLLTRGFLPLFFWEVSLIFYLSFTPYAERIGNAIDVIKPRCYQGYLQNARVIKANGAKFFVMIGCDFGSVLCNLHNKFDHYHFGFSNWCSFVISL